MSDNTLIMLTGYLTDSLMLDTPLIHNDPAYLQLEGSIPLIIQMAARSLGKSDLSTLTEKEIYAVSLKSQYTIYLRLATAVAPEFDMSAEQVSFKKGNRFFHYTALAEKVASELKQINVGDIEVAPIVLSSRNGTLRNYNLSQTQNLKLKVDAISKQSINLSWKIFDQSFGEFANYTLSYSESPVYDEYAEETFRTGEDVVTRVFYDIKRHKFRLTGLKPDTSYYIVLIFNSKDGGKSIEQIQVSTGDSLDWC